MARLLSVNVGLPRDIEWQGKTVHTAVWKTPVQGRRMTRRLNVDGDGQGDLAGHGGEHRAVFVYQIESYRYWQNQLGREPHGAAGAYIDTRVEGGDILDVSTPRGSFTLRQGEGPVVLVSAGIGATPVLAMLHALAAKQTGQRFGRFTAPATAASIHLRRRCANSSRPCPEAAATFVTVRHSQPIGRLSISTAWGA
jgi:hypothetical protein